MKYIDIPYILKMYKKMIEATGGSFGIRNIGLLESAIQNSKATFEGIELYPTTVEKCSKYMLFNN